MLERWSAEPDEEEDLPQFRMPALARLKRRPDGSAHRSRAVQRLGSALPPPAAEPALPPTPQTRMIAMPAPADPLLAELARRLAEPGAEQLRQRVAEALQPPPRLDGSGLFLALRRSPMVDAALEMNARFNGPEPRP